MSDPPARLPGGAKIRALLLDLLIWLVACAVAIGFAVSPLDEAKLDGKYIPTQPDSFYHATRIMATYRDPAAFFQWDDQSFYPGGAFDSWPWFYDYTIARALRLISPDDPVKVMDFIPPAWILVNALLLLMICRNLQLAWQARTLALACFAISPLTQMLHMVGRIDHHFMEYTMVLGSLASMLWWSRKVDSTGRAAIAGLVPGLAVGVNPGDFAIQLPLLLAVAFCWWHGRPFPQRASLVAAGALVVATAFEISLSMPVLVGLFRYDLLSWFHLYVAACTAIALWLMSRFRFSYLRLVSFGVLGIAALVPLVRESVGALRFLDAGNSLTGIGETQSFLARPGFFLDTHSGLVLLVPFVIAGSVYALARSKRPEIIILSAYSAFGLVLLLTQHRLNYFGSFALYVPALLALQHWLRSQNIMRQRLGWAAAASVAVVANVTSPGYLLRPVQPGGGQAFELAAYKVLSAHCRQAQATVLAPIDDGHQLRYFTGCRTMANEMQGIDFIQTAKAEHVRSLLALTPEALRNTPDDFQYLWVDNTAAVRKSDPGNVVHLGISQYFFKDGGPPPGYRLLAYNKVIGPWWWATANGTLYSSSGKESLKLDDSWFIEKEVGLYAVEK